MTSLVDVPVALPGLKAVRFSTEELHTGVKEHHGIGRIERGHSEYWGRGRVWRAEPGCVVLKRPGDVHRDLEREGTTIFLALTIPSAELERYGSRGLAFGPPQFAPQDERAAAAHRLLDAVRAGADRLTLEVTLCEALGSLSELARSAPGHARRVQRAQSYLRDRLADPIALDDLAAHTGMDKYHLCRAFRAQVGIPPYRYLTYLRVARAAQLLQRGHRASEIAPLVGFYDQAQLTRHFRRITGTTPGRFVGAVKGVGARGVQLVRRGG